MLRHDQRVCFVFRPYVRQVGDMADGGLAGELTVPEAVGRPYRTEVLRSCEDPWADPGAGPGGRSDMSTSCCCSRGFSLCWARAEVTSDGSSSAILLDNRWDRHSQRVKKLLVEGGI